MGFILDEWAREQARERERDRSAEGWDNGERGQKVTDEEIAAIRERLAAATPGPWYVGAGEFVQQDKSHMAICRVNNPVVNDVRRGVTVDGGRGSNEPNKWFIAHAPADIADLLAFAEAALPILEELAAFSGVEYPLPFTWLPDGRMMAVMPDNLRTAFAQARALLAGKGEEDGA